MHRRGAATQQMGLRRHNPKGGIILRRSSALRLLDDTRCIACVGAP
jgi:hypothetical protein